MTVSTRSVAHYFLKFCLPKNYKRAFEFGKVIIKNTVSFFTLDTVKTALL